MQLTAAIFFHGGVLLAPCKSEACFTVSWSGQQYFPELSLPPPTLVFLRQTFWVQPCLAVLETEIYLPCPTSVGTKDLLHHLHQHHHHLA